MKRTGDKYTPTYNTKIKWGLKDERVKVYNYYMIKIAVKPFFNWGEEQCEHLLKKTCNTVSSNQNWQ